ALVADRGRVRAEYIAVTDPGTVKDPVVGAVNRIAAESGAHVATDAVITPARERDAGHVVLRSTDDDVGPERRHFRCTVSSVERVALEEGLVSNHHVLTLALDATLPQRGVAREERRVPAAGDEVFDRVTHAARPVLVVADRQIQARAVQHLGMLFEIGV